MRSIVDAKEGLIEEGRTQIDDLMLTGVPNMSQYDAIVIGSGPNGLSAAVEMARNGARGLVLEATETIGGGTRTTELTLPGYLHNFCSAVHPIAVNLRTFI